jgi:hypothetical protein
MTSKALEAISGNLRKGLAPLWERVEIVYYNITKRQTEGKGRRSM